MPNNTLKGRPECLVMVLPDGSELKMIVNEDLCGVVLGRWRGGDYGLPGLSDRTILRILRGNRTERLRLWGPVVLMSVVVRYPNEETFTWTTPEEPQGHQSRTTSVQKPVRGLFLWDEEGLDRLAGTFARNTTPGAAPANWMRVPTLLATTASDAPNIFHCPWIKHMQVKD